jgi:hypothetical protein
LYRIGHGLSNCETDLVRDLLLESEMSEDGGGDEVDKLDVLEAATDADMDYRLRFWHH